ncbi:FG-GAP repeat domain-containing protein [Pleomorphovibrio marinus]|uniref:FG-GAP repeat domain-containing protein n=1 Tax=Pleomorphovibrio marinus TaxID=2164132 RepID=UPI000E0AC349|nr:VCBS repeat-containing protein [Pleomorphovibrio marinus]
MAAGQDSGPWKRHVIDDSSLGSDGTKLADVNQNGHMDIVVGWEEGGVTRLYFNPGKVEETWEYVEVPSPDVEDAFAVDLDGDGFMDLVTFSEGEHQRITVHWAPSDSLAYRDSRRWVSEDIPVTVKMTKWMFGRAVDIDGQNGVDLIVGSKNPNGRLGWLESPENPRDLSAWNYHHLSDAGWIMSIEWMDMDKDGIQDILITDRYGELSGLRWLKNPGQGEGLSQPWENHFIGLREGEPMFLGLADIPPLNGSGLPGIIVPDLTNGWEIFVFEGDTWTSQLLPYPSISGTRGKSVAVADIRLTGEWDLLASFEGAKDQSGVIGMGDFLADKPFLMDISGKEGVKYDFIVLIDMDGDGDLDILTCEETGYDGSKSGLGVIWYENPAR